MTDGAGVTWIADAYFSDASSTYDSDDTISGETPGREALYQSERYEDKDPDDTLTYEIPVPRGGTYTVTLHFAGKRLLGLLSRL